MKESVEDRMLSELFRQKLENAEIIPSPAAGARIMKKVGMKEFLRFNPLRMNIWYAGGTLVAAASLALFLTTGSQKRQSSETSEPSSQTVPVTDRADSTSDTGYMEIVSKQPLKDKQAIERSSQKPRGSTRAGISQNVNPVPDRRNENLITPVSGNDVYNKSNTVSENLKDQRFLSGEIGGASVKEGCAPLKISFKSLIRDCDSCRWTFGDGGFSVLKDPRYIYDLPGEYQVNLSVYRGKGIVSSSSFTVIVHETPQARFEFTPEKPILPSDEISFHNYSSDAVKYKWDFGDGSGSDLFEPVHTYAKAGQYNLKLVATTESGCSDSVLVKNAFSVSGNYIVFPNAFLPNLNGPSNGFYSAKSDESAQVFHPVTSGVSVYQLRIFNRRGMLLFESNDINIGWDGYYKGQLCDPGVYIWKVRGNYLNGESFTRMGDVTLLKN